MRVSSVGRSIGLAAVAAVAVLAAIDFAAAQMEPIPEGGILIGDGQNIHPESIAATPDGGLLIGSVAGPWVFRAGPGENTAELWISTDDVIEDGFVLGVFASGDTAWVCANGPFGSGLAVLVSYSLDTGQQTGAFPLPGRGAGGGVCNDIAVSPDGTVFITETNGAGVGQVLALVANDDGERSLSTIVGGSSIGGVAGLAFLNGALYVNDVFANKLYRLTLAGTKLVALETMNLSRPIGGPDGMRTTIDGGSMLLAENAKDRLSLVTIRGSMAVIKVLAEGFKQPTAVAQVGATAYVVEPAFGALFDPQAPDPGPFYAMPFDLES